MKKKYQLTYFLLALLCLILANFQLLGQPEEVTFAYSANCGSTPNGMITAKVVSSPYINPPFEFLWTDNDGLTDNITVLYEYPQDGISQIGNLVAGEYCLTQIS